jgi:transcriptional regulator of aromatic amino acid metabolism
MESSPQSTPSLGRTWTPALISGRYALRRKLGSGSSGTVYLAHDAVRDRQVAIKVIRSESVTPRGIASLQQEFQAIASLRHPQIASAFDFGYTEAGLPFYTREYVSGGTLLLDEIGLLAPESQAKLLQVLDSGVFRRLGEVESRRADVRFLASTSTDLKAAVVAGRFRADLYYRLCGVEVSLPPLRSRREDIPPLALHFIQKHSQRLGLSLRRLTKDAEALLERHDWPGNVRELEGVLLRILVTGSGREVTARDLSPLLGEEEKPLFDEGLMTQHGLPELKLALERQYLTSVFQRCGGDVRRMMKLLQIKRTRLYTWYRKLGIDLPELRKRL